MELCYENDCNQIGSLFEDLRARKALGNNDSEISIRSLLM